MKAVVFGYHNMGCLGLELLKDTGFDIQAVFTHPDDPDENIWFDSVAEWASDWNIPAYAPADVNDPVWLDLIADLKPDVIFSFYYRNLLGKEILDVAKVGAFNLHGSLLPSYRGRCPVNWVLIHGEEQTGVTLHVMTARPDQGPIVDQLSVAIDEHDDARTLFAKLENASRALLRRSLPLILSRSFKLEDQDHSRASYFGGRGPEDGKIDWRMPAASIRNLVRAVTEPYPGAFTFCHRHRITVWRSRVVALDHQAEPGTVLSTKPWTIACGSDALVIQLAQLDNDIKLAGSELCTRVGLMENRVLGRERLQSRTRKKVLILGVNGFIGNHLTERLLDDGGYEVYGMDLDSGSLDRFVSHPDFHFFEGDISIHREWIEYHVRKCDVVIPLVAIATPIEYTRNPLRVFELDFEENLRIVRYCVQYRKRLIFPSTSEVYGMCRDHRFDEHTSNFVLGPINKQRWIYSCSKQLLDRVIWAYGQKEDLDFTLFRPFNWVGPRLDSLESARVGSSRVVTQFILNLVEGTPIQLVGGGQQRRCFTDVRDGVEGLFRIIENRDQCASSRIFNLGAPDNEASIGELADLMIQLFERNMLSSHFPIPSGVRVVDEKAYYGKGYQDLVHRKPSITNARRHLGWMPSVGLSDAIESTLDFFVRSAMEERPYVEAGASN